MSESRFVVGQTVLRRDVNENRLGGPQRVKVTKVGRTLVHVEGGWAETFRIEDGRRNDRRGHSWLQTEEEYAAEQARTQAQIRLVAHGIRFDYGFGARITVSTLNAIADLLDAEARP